MLILVFILAFQLSEGPILWIYSAETCRDEAFGFVTLGQFINLFVISMLTEYIVAWLKPHGTFFFFGIMTYIGGLYIFYFVKETKGLTDKEKKNLYSPINIIKS
jgi:SP family facilitated glucose transporter-like MFS transporter 1